MVINMEYIWEMFLQGQNDDIFLKQADIVSPYYELPPEQPAEKESKTAEYNAMFRYEDIFAPMLTQAHEGEGLDSFLFNVFSHYLVEVDLKRGLSVSEYQRRKVMERLSDGIYGEQVLELYQKLSAEKQRRLAYYMRRAEETEPTVYLFSKAVIDLLGTGALYQDKDDRDLLILYVGRKKNDTDEHVIEITKFTLLPIGRRLRLMWDCHFGVIAERATMQYDKIEIL